MNRTAAKGLTARARTWCGRICVSVAAVVLAACSSGGRTGAPAPPPPAGLQVGGSVSGIDTGTLVLQVTGGERVSLTANGSFLFTTRFQPGQTYDVTVVSAPAKKFTDLLRNSGVVNAEVRDVSVQLVEGFYVSGELRGSAGTYELELNGAERLSVTGPGPFRFDTLLRNGQAYQVAVVSAPGDTGTTLTGNAGTIAASDVGTVRVDASASRTLGGNVTGLVGNVTLRNYANGEEITLSATGPFTLANRVAEGSTYDVRVLYKQSSQRIVVRNGAGTMGGTNVTAIEVICTDKAWIHPADLNDNISPDFNDADSVSLAVGSHGEALIPWEYGSRLYYSRRADNAWTHPRTATVTPLNPAGGSMFHPRAAYTFQGDAVLVWSQRDGVRERIYKANLRNGTWQPPTGHSDYLSPDSGDCLHPEVVVDTTGDAFVVWEQYVNGNGRIFKSEYRAGVWSKPTSAADGISPDSTHAQDVSIAVGPTGHVVVVWVQSDNHNYRLYMSEYRNGSWTHPTSLAAALSPAGTDAWLPKVAFDGLGNGVVAWLQNDGANAQVFKAEFRGGNWSFPTGLTDNISPGGTSAHGVEVATARNGHAIIVWRQDIAGGATSLFKSEYRGSSWSHPAGAGDHFAVGPFVNEFAVAMDSEGSTAVVYTSADASLVYGMLKSEYRNGAWTHAAALTDRFSPTGSTVSSPWVGFDGQDDAVVLWRQRSNGFQHAFISEYR